MCDHRRRTRLPSSRSPRSPSSRCRAPRFCTSSRAASTRGAAPARVGARDPRRHALPPRVRNPRAVGDSRLVGDGVHGREAPRRAVPDRDRHPHACSVGATEDATDPQRPPGGRRRDFAEGVVVNVLQPEDGAVLPGLPAAVRRPGQGTAVAPDPRARPHVHRARPRHRLGLGARCGVGRRDVAEEPDVGAGAAIRLWVDLRRPRPRDGPDRARTASDPA